MATQVAGELYYEIDGQLSEIKRQLRQPVGYPFDPKKLKIALQDAIEGNFNAEPKKEAQAQSKLFSIVAPTTQLGALLARKTAACYVGDIWDVNGRDGNFDCWLKANQPATGPCTITTLAPSQTWTFAEGAQALPGITATDDVVALGNQLIAHAMTPQQHEEMAVRTEDGEKTGLAANVFGNFCFIETGDPKNPVSVGCIRRVGRDWQARVYRLDDDFHWGADHCLLVCNLDASKLGA